MEIKIEKLNEAVIAQKGIKKWPVWEKEISEFDWYYDSKEQCLFLEGHVIVESELGPTEFGKGDFVTFPEGLKCKWRVLKPVKKHYKFG